MSDNSYDLDNDNTGKYLLVFGCVVVLCICLMGAIASFAKDESYYKYNLGLLLTKQIIEQRNKELEQGISPEHAIGNEAIIEIVKNLYLDTDGSVTQLAE